jgi:MFS family permease
MMVGALVYLGAVIVGLSGVTGAHFFATLFLAGLGWNLVFTSGSAMLVEVVPKKDIPRAQGVSESMTIVGACSGTVGSGLVWGWFGEWSTIMWFAGAGPVLAVGCTAMAGLFIEQQGQQRRDANQSKARGLEQQQKTTDGSE